MNCPDCKTEMEKGVLAVHGQRFFTGNWSRYDKLVPGFLKKGSQVNAFKCPIDGKIELQAEIDKG